VQGRTDALRQTMGTRRHGAADFPMDYSQGNGPLHVLFFALIPEPS